MLILSFHWILAEKDLKFHNFFMKSLSLVEIHL